MRCGEDKVSGRQGVSKKVWQRQGARKTRCQEDKVSGRQGVKTTRVEEGKGSGRQGAKKTMGQEESVARSSPPSTRSYLPTPFPYNFLRPVSPPSSLSPPPFASTPSPHPLTLASLATLSLYLSRLACSPILLSPLILDPHNDVHMM